MNRYTKQSVRSTGFSAYATEYSGCHAYAKEHSGCHAYAKEHSGCHAYAKEHSGCHAYAKEHSGCHAYAKEHSGCHAYAKLKHAHAAREHGTLSHMLKHAHAAREHGTLSHMRKHAHTAREHGTLSHMRKHAHAAREHGTLSHMLKHAHTAREHGTLSHPRLSGRFVLTLAFLLLLLPSFTVAQQPTSWNPRVEGDGVVSTTTKTIFEKGLGYLAANQKADGTWTGKLQIGGYKKGTDPQSPGATNGETALSLMCFLSSGEDPNFGRYSKNVHRAVRALLLAQNPTTGYIGKNMYEHGFSMLALSEAYGVVDESRLEFPKGMTPEPKLAKALELAVGCAMKGQKTNVHKAWTYGPDNKRNHEGTRADTSVSGAVLMGLLGARNAGIKVPDHVIDQALEYFRSMTIEGKTAYATRMNWATPETRSAITALVMTIGKRTHWKEFKPIPEFITTNLHYVDEQHPFYSRYYMAQALFQVDIPAWKKWHKHQLDVIGKMQQPDGSIIPESKGGFTSSYQTPAYTTSMSLLALALEYRILPIYERWPAKSK